MGTRPRFWAVLGLLRQSLPGADSGAGAAANSFLRAAGCGLRGAGALQPDQSIGVLHADAAPRAAQ